MLLSEICYVEQSEWSTKYTLEKLYWKQFPYRKNLQKSCPQYRLEQIYIIIMHYIETNQAGVFIRLSEAILHFLIMGFIPNIVVSEFVIYQMHMESLPFWLQWNLGIQLL